MVRSTASPMTPAARGRLGSPSLTWANSTAEDYPSLLEDWCRATLEAAWKPFPPRLASRFRQSRCLALTVPRALIVGRRTHPRGLRWSRRLLRVFLVVLALPPVGSRARRSRTNDPASGGGKKPLTIADYSRWRNIDGAELSPDGKWVAYALRFTNTLPADAKPRSTS